MFVCLETFDFFKYFIAIENPNFFDDCQTAVVQFLSHFSVVGCQLLSRRHLPSPCHLQTSCMSTSSVLIPGLVTPNNQQISLLIFLHQTLWVQNKRLSLNSLLCGKLSESKTVLCHYHPLPASYRVFSLKNVLNGCEHHRRVCVCAQV